MKKNANKYDKESQQICQTPTKASPDDLHPDPSNINVHNTQIQFQQIQAWIEKIMPTDTKNILKK